MQSSYLETIKAVDGKVYNLSYHQNRYESVLNSLGKTTFKSLKDYLFPPKEGTYRCRLLYTKDSIEVHYHLYKKREIKRLKIVHDDTITYEKKYADREIIDKLYLQKEYADDILIIKNSLVTDTSIANIAFFDGKQWFTPAKPLLLGTTRARLLEKQKIVVKDIYFNELKKYKKIALLNAMIDFDIIAINNIRDFYC